MLAVYLEISVPATEISRRDDGASSRYSPAPSTRGLAFTPGVNLY
jgi:hypothetical protein